MSWSETSNEGADPYDGPWKLGIDAFLPQLMLIFFPASYAEIDWSRSYQPLNAELQGILPAEEAGSRRFADALYQVWRHDGREQWIILHLEVQSQPDPELSRRMFVYAYRCFEKYGSEVFGYAILGDRSASFRPRAYEWKLGAARLRYEYETIKLIDLDPDELAASDNPVALMALAHLYTGKTRDDQTRRRVFKLRLIRLLFHKGYDRFAIEKLFQVLDWMMRLSREQGIIFAEELKALTEEPQMSSEVYTLDKVFRYLGHQEGEKAGRMEGARRVLRSQLDRRFGELPPWAKEKLEAADTDTVERWSLQLLDASSIEDVFA